MSEFEQPDSNKVSERNIEVLTLNNEPEKSVIEPTPREKADTSEVSQKSSDKQIKASP
jgi:hypothetical protein